MREQHGALLMHQHTFISGPHNHGGAASQFLHCHEGGNRAHRHEDTGPAYYPGGIGRAKSRLKPHGRHLPLVSLTDEERTFTVVFVDQYTDGHAGAGISRERWERERAAFIDLLEGGARFDAISVERRLREEFDLRAIYRLDPPEDAAVAAQDAARATGEAG